jgi:hypothetical protein
MVIGAAVMWAIILSNQRSGASAGVGTIAQQHIQPAVMGPGLSLLRGAALCKLMVTPLMMAIMILITCLPLLCCCACFVDDFELGHQYYAGLGAPIVFMREVEIIHFGYWFG